jgi:uncharacterized protein (TIGR03000 family)
MFRSTISAMGIATLTAVLMAFTASPVLAQHRGGGGGHGGAAHVGGGAAHVGAAHVGAAHVSGFRGGAVHTGAYRGYAGRGYAGYNRGYGGRGYVGYGRGYYGGYGLGYGWPWLGAAYAWGWPYSYGGYGYSYPDYSDYYYPGDTTIYNTYPSNSYYYNPDVVPSANTTPSSALTATITIHVPPNAKVWFDGTPTQQTGEWREFASPPLDRGQTFHYDVRAQWMDNGKMIDQTRRVEVSAGSLANVDFLRPNP